MGDFGDIERRIERVCSRASTQPIDGWVLAEMGDVLAVGYASALKADAHIRRLADRIDRLLQERDHPHAADEAHRLSRERRSVQDATRRLRSRLEVVRTLFARAGGRSGSG
jgi:hypothetical protein